MNDALSDELHPGDPLYRAAEALRDPVPILDGLPDRVGVRRVRRRRQQQALRGVALVALLAAGGLMLRPRSADRPVTFVLNAPESHSVALVGDFTDWQRDQIQLSEGEGGKWQVTVKLPPGRYRFAYLVDKAEWRADAEADPIPDDFGRPTSVVTVTTDP